MRLAGRTAFWGAVQFGLGEIDRGLLGMMAGIFVLAAAQIHIVFETARVLRQQIAPREATSDHG